MKAYTINLSFESVTANNPQEAALEICEWILKDNGARRMCYEVTDEETNEKFDIDLEKVK